MNRIPVFVGLDYHSRFVQVCVMNGHREILGQYRCQNDALEIATKVANLGNEVHAGIESCSGAAHLAEELVEQSGWSIDLAHPGYVNRLKQNPDKTDTTDAQLLADLVCVGYLPRVWLAPAALRELRQLVRYRQQLVNQRRNQKLRVSAVLREHRIYCQEARPWTLKWMSWITNSGLPLHSSWVVQKHIEQVDWLNHQIKEVESKLKEQTQADSLVQQLRQYRGIGYVVAWTLRAEIGRFDRFRSGKQVAKFCGLSPRNASSGERQADAGLIKAANPQLRSILIEAAHLLIRHDPRWSLLAKKLRAAGKPVSVIAAAIANRWIRWLYVQLTMKKVA